MDNRGKIVRRYMKYLSTSILGFAILYYVYTNQHVHSILYRMLKNAVHQQQSCNTSKNIKKIYHTSYSELYTLYFRHNTPVIVIDAMFDWFTLTHSFTIHNFTRVYHEPRYRNAIPCELSSSINFDSTDHLYHIFDTVSQLACDGWFINWKSCDLTSAKAVRHFYEQPYFTKYYLPAPERNSVIVYSNYVSSSSYQESSVSSRILVMLMQVRGSLDVKLVPSQCSTVCDTITTILEESQILVLKADFWQLKYSSPSRDTSIAILTENEIPDE